MNNNKICVFLREEIPSDLESLDDLHDKFPWIPSRDEIRPSFENLAKKFNFMDTLHLQWFSLDDFLLHHVFGKEYSIFQGKKLILQSLDETNELDGLDESEETNEMDGAKKASLKPVLQECLFPYRIQTDKIYNSFHYVLWFPVKEEQSSEVIQTHLEKLIHPDIQFAWYVNPKPSVHNFFHVQVFTNLKL